MKMFRRASFNIRNAIGLGWFQNKKLLIFLGLFALVGIVIGCFVIFDPMVNYFRINHGLLDGNVMNVASSGRGILSFIFSRFLDIFFALILVFLFCMSKWTVLLVFPYVAFRGFWAVINLFWIIDRYGFFHGLTFFLVYLIIFAVLLVMFMCFCVFLLKRGTMIRQYGFRAGCSWRDIRMSILWIVVGIILVAFVEWLLYFVLLGRLFFMP